MKRDRTRQAGSLSHVSRREAISRIGSGFGGLALGALLGDFDRTARGRGGDSRFASQAAASSAASPFGDPAFHAWRPKSGGLAR